MSQGDQDSANSLPPSASTLSGNLLTTGELHIPAPLKFLISNLKNLVPHALTGENYAIWRIQILQQFTANGYSGHLLGTTPCPADDSSQESHRWHLIDNNLISALFSTISPPILPYVISSTTALDVWLVLERRLQPTCRSRVIQLKNELYHVQMRNLTMPQYLSHIKTIVDNIAASGSNVDNEDIILHILNGLPTIYNSFKTAIRTSALPINLDNLYSLLCSEEINVTRELAKETSAVAGSTALYTSSSNTYRNRNSRQFHKNKNQMANTPTPASSPTVPTPINYNTGRSTCQICNKQGHIALNCWHRNNPRFAPTNSRSMSALFAQPNSSQSQDWIIDSGASNHLTPDLGNLQYPNTFQGQEGVSIANGTQLPVHHSGQGLLPLPDTPRKLHLRNLLHVPKLSHNLLSVSQLTTDNPVSISFDANGFEIKDLKDHHPLHRGHLRNGLYHLRRSGSSNTSAFHTNLRSAQLWHARLGHPHNRLLTILANKIPEIKNVSSSVSCTSCTMAKCHKFSFNKTTSVTSHPFDLIHSDVWGPSPVQSTEGFRYYVIFIDDFTRFSWVYLMNSKNEVLSKFKLLCKFIQTQFNTIPKAFRSDGGGEFTSHDFTMFLHHQGIQRQLSCPHTPEQNGIAERKHRHLLELTRTLLHASNLPHTLWAEALSTATYLVNRLPSSAISFHTPFYRLHNRHPRYDHLRTFGCQCFPWLKPYAANKLAPRSQECVFIGYSPIHRGYKCLDLATNKLHISRHVTFNENFFPYSHAKNRTSPPSSRPTHYTNPLLLTPHFTGQTHSIPNSTPSPTVPQNSITLPAIQQPSMDLTQHNPVNTMETSLSSPILPSHPMQTRLKSGISKPKHILSLLSSTNPMPTPATYAQAHKHKHWCRAMEDEFAALQKQSTWTLVPAPPNKPILGCKWTFKTKVLPNGKIDRYKARLVAQGYDQQFGINYTETFSPVAKMPTLRILFTVAVHRNWQILQLDVSNAFLHGDLSEDIYMRQPIGFVDPKAPNSVCKLHKSLYGLKQAPRKWFEKLTSFLQNQGFRFSRSDPSLLIFSHNHIQMFLLIYVDDFLLTGNDASAIQALLSILHSEFALKQLGNISLFLGIQVVRQPSGIFLTQQHYAEQLIKESGLEDCNQSPTPFSPKTNSCSTQTEPFSDPTLYRRLAGSLQYLSITRPDIAFATNQVCQHMHQPTVQDFQSLKRLLRYIKGTTSFGLPLTSGELILQTYTDADWASDSSDRKSISGFCTFLGPNLISWTVKKQVTVAKSSTEAEYRSLSAATSDVIWLRRLAEEFDLPQTTPTLIHCGNTSAIALAKNPVFHARTKHIEIDYHFIRQHIASGEISIHHISSTEQIADILTKQFNPARFHELRRKLTIRQQNA
ncbi:Retrovirus-related Pol polyprotein from transposon TNT 1-94 [Dendrobium catenatum]|uniref:Retrovirus-related Pol polyprotein from transposon TNT 1-94 n=1 Tax=Dendrobium catenatum TaxID=906689 RepID=A0A2I0VS58_9ASPA|nr:Retrovirus-related Pol polyprotein from transposon TNT 1-94 [Dendrobium catenatum]